MRNTWTTRGFIARTLAVWTLAVGVWACGTTATTDSTGGADAGDAIATDAGKDAKDAKDSSAGADQSGVTDGEGGDVPVVDADDATATTDTDTVAPDADTGDTAQANCQAEPGAPFCPCQDNSTCDLPLCLPTAQGSQCAKPCIDSCPDGFKCVGVSGPGGDLVTVCVDKSPHLCDPCTASSQCGAVGLQGAACVDAGKDGHFCGTLCAADSDCPTGYTCADATSVEGNSVKQCRPAAGATCTCSTSAIANQLSTSCFAEVKDDQGKVIGQCKGARSCSPDGLTACNASIQTETCNGVDDDCDGQIDEGTCDDKNACTSDTCDAKAQACGHTNAPGSCDADGNNCTVGDQCVNGECQVGSLKSCDDGNPCTVDACDPVIGCTKQNDDGLPCSDGSACTVGDSCSGGVCQAGAAKTCPGGSQCLSYACDAATGKCEASKKTDGTSCSDGTVCTSADTCKNGDCAGVPVDCDDKNPCTLDTCDAVAGCKHDAANIPCDDGNACTDNDTCTNKKCLGTAIVPAVECDDQNPCTTDTCDKFAPSITLRCLHTNNTLSCSDGLSCTVGDKCQGGACVSGTNTCSCQVDTDCPDDGNLCNGKPFCDTSGATNACKVNPATIVTCSTLGDTLCSQNVCNPSTGKCGYVNAADGKACDADGTVCTVADSCQGGVCLAGPAKVCDDLNPCTDDACDPVNGCSNTANTSPCNADDNACTVNDTCNAKLCQVGQLKTCNDGEYCTVDSCDQMSGACKFDPKPDNTTCDADGSVCTQGDSCVGGVCKAGASVTCDDQNACTTDSCDIAQGCGHKNLADGTACGAPGDGYTCFSLQCVKCGNGKIEAGEQCDDGNNIGGDGCSATCQFDAPVTPAPGELIFTEIMPAPNTASDEWCEVYNNSMKPLLLEGLYFGDNQYYLTLTNGSGNWVLMPGQYATIAALSKIGGNKTGAIVPDFTYGYSSTGPQFGNSGDSFCISTDTQCVTGIIAKVTYGSTSGDQGYSYTLRQSKYATVFATGKATYNTSNWCTGSTLIPGGDADYGTPGTVDPNCK